ncbi:hypothetical protein FLA_2310 [Filimonas lacunae]|nr:hypothetical protein FLA_2310 [Filimonas lacunae]
MYNIPETLSFAAQQSFFAGYPVLAYINPGLQAGVRFAYAGGSPTNLSLQEYS